jgi:hypothetical protein
MYHSWMPFVNKSAIVKEIGKCEMLIWFNIHVPFIASRDALVHVFACDYTEKGILLVCGGSVEHMDGCEVPPRPTDWGCDRMDVKDFRVQIRMTGTTTAEVHVIANIAPKVPLPQPVINFGTRKLAGMLLYYMRIQVRRAHIRSWRLYEFTLPGGAGRP